ncbi:MAG: hypothetical protein KatS3mg102_0013 [Planctomycetota bacterium]|nr:MAG: hypothetical protein KatS3mg102_0013 [Planctomycetota bacterium]
MAEGKRRRSRAESYFELARPEPDAPAPEPAAPPQPTAGGERAAEREHPAASGDPPNEPAAPRLLPAGEPPAVEACPGAPAVQPPAAPAAESRPPSGVAPAPSLERTEPVASWQLPRPLEQEKTDGATSRGGPTTEPPGLPPAPGRAPRGRKAVLEEATPGPITANLPTAEMPPELLSEPLSPGEAPSHDPGRAAGAPAAREPTASGLTASAAAPPEGAGDWRRLEELRRRHEDDPHDVDVLLRYAQVTLEFGNREEAERLLEVARRLAPGDLALQRMLEQLGAHADLTGPVRSAPAAVAAAPVAPPEATEPGARSQAHALARIWGGAVPAAVLAGAGSYLASVWPALGWSVLAVAAVWVVAAQGAAARAEILAPRQLPHAFARGAAALLSALLAPAAMGLGALLTLPPPATQQPAATSPQGIAVERYARWLAEREQLPLAEARARARQALDVQSLGPHPAGGALSWQGWLAAALAGLALLYGLALYAGAVAVTVRYGSARAAFAHGLILSLAVRSGWGYARAALPAVFGLLAAAAACALVPWLPQRLPLAAALGTAVSVAVATLAASLALVAAAYRAGRLGRSHNGDPPP